MAADDGRPDEDAIYRQVGRLVVVFQLLENKIFQLGSFAADPGHTGTGQAALAPLWFKELVRQTGMHVAAFLDSRQRPAPDFRAHVEELLGQARKLAEYRNRVVHSAYLFLEGGGELRAVLRSDMTAAGDSVEFDQEALDETSFDDALTEIAQLAFEIGLCQTQLIHWL